MIDFAIEQVGRLAEDETKHGRSQKRFEILSLEDLANLPDPAWVINGILPKGGIVELHGMPATGKSFLALDMALHIATGSSWHGHSTEQGPVLYVAAEGATGYKRRVDAWKAGHGIEDIDSLYFIASGVQLHEETDIEGLIDSLKETGVQSSLVIFDTLARCFVGADENSSTAMGQLLEGAARIGEELNATVLLVHHTRKDGSTERGSIALRGGVDSMMSLERHRQTKFLTLTSVKMKNAPDFEAKTFRLATVGDSCLIEPVQTTQKKASPKKPPKTKAELCLAILPEEGASHSDWLALVQDTKICSKATFNRSLETLSENGLVEAGDDGLYRPLTRD